MFNKLIVSLVGRKTLIVALAMLLFAFLGMGLGRMDTNTGVEIILNALGMLGIRAAIAGK